MKYLKVLGLILVIFTITAQLFCVPTIQPFQNQKTLEFEKREGCQYRIIQTKDEDPIIIEYDPAQVEDIIVEFTEQPYFIEKKNNPDSQRGQSFYTNRFYEFENDVLNLYDKISTNHKAPVPQPEFTEGIYGVFFGINVKVPKIMMSAIHELPYVKKLHKNKLYTADLLESVPLIQADSVWYNYGTMGDSIVVGVIDTGIDYTHPHLGRAFGPGFKVIDGYDFIHMDNDPMDDNGHGTHVAGIVAGDGYSLKGVAPHALLMAFKVLDEEGTGTEWRIINGVNRALDPNWDGDYSDKVDVINMSLGGSGDPDDALSITVDNASALGVISCISAGNSYTWKSIRSPGNARTALTVGSTNKSDEISYFSSKGPNTKILTMKPEVVAPGEEIYSLALNNGFTFKSGTSMSAPHVAGICALLKSLHPDWTPEKIKSAIMLSAKDLNEHVMAQGCGRVNANKAAKVDILAIPACASFGLDETSQNIWTKTETIKIINESDTIQDFMVFFSGIKTGISLSASPQNFSLSPNDSTTILITLSVDNSSVTPPPSINCIHDGDISIHTTNQELILPWSFAIQAIIRLTFDCPFSQFLFVNEHVIIYESEATQIGCYSYEFESPFGLYDIISFMDKNNRRYCVFYEDVNIQSNIEFEIFSDEAQHEFRLAAVDEQGRLLSSLENATNLRELIPPDDFISSGIGYINYPNTWFVSDISEDYTFICGETQFDIDNEHICHIVNHEIVQGITDDITLSNNSLDFFVKHLALKFPPGFNTYYVNIGDYYKSVFPRIMIEMGHFASSTITQVTINSDYKWSIPLYYNESTSEFFKTGLALIAQENDYIFDETKQWYRTAPIYSIDDNIASYRFLTNSSTYIPVNEDTLCFGEGLVYPYFYFSKFDNYMIIYPPPNCCFYGSLDEKREKDTYESTFSIFDQDNNLITSGMLDEAYECIKDIYFNNEKYNFETTNSNYFISGYNGMATCNNIFDMAQEDASPPQITSYKLFDSNGRIAHRLLKNESGIIQFSGLDYKITGHDLIIFEEGNIVVDSTRLHYKEHGSNVWQEVQVTPIVQDSMIGWLYEADATPLTNYDSTAIDLKLSFRDDCGNKTIWKMEPAFAVGDFHVAIDEEEPQYVITEPIILHPNYPNPFCKSTHISFSLQKPATSAILKIYNIKGELVSTIRKENFEAGENHIEWNGLDSQNRNVSNGIYFYTLQIDSEKFEPRKMIVLR